MGTWSPTPLAGRIIDLARNAMRVVQAGATTVPMTSQTLKMARLTGEGTPAWHAENAAITDAAFQLRFLSERYIDSGQYAFLAYLRADVQLAHGEAFVVDRGVRG